MSQDALGQLKHLKTARARWPFPDAWVSLCISYLRPTYNPVPRSIEIDIEWPTSLIGGERPGGSEFECVRP